jgi:quercetin dioxygenase-like cupin family protein
MYLKMIFAVLPALIVLLTPATEGQVITPLLEQNLTAPAPDVTATVLDLSFAPGDAGSPPHTHSGPTIGYVVEGEFLFQVAGEPVRILKAGESFYELDGAIHVWGANASNMKACKVIATVYGRPGEPILTFVDNYKREGRTSAIVKARLHQAFTSMFGSG